MSRIVNAIMILPFLPFWPFFWLSCRLLAQRCPECSSKWRTELQGEWDGEEDWKCHHCGFIWHVPY